MAAHAEMQILVSGWRPSGQPASCPRRGHVGLGTTVRVFTCLLMRVRLWHARPHRFLEPADTLRQCLFKTALSRSGGEAGRLLVVCLLTIFATVGAFLAFEGTYGM